MIDRMLDWIGYRCINLSEKLKGHMEMIDYWKRYIADDPYELKRITYPLNSDSLVVDVGGYKGEWSQRIFSRYCCRIDIYEPHPILVMIAKEHFKFNPDVMVIPVGLSDGNKTMQLFGNDIYSSLYSNYGAEPHRVTIRKASQIFKEQYDGMDIDLLKINIEGAEYRVLPELLVNYPMSTIKNIQIQFHKLDADSEQKRNDIRYHLAKTHSLNWNYEWQYENWTVNP